MADMELAGAGSANQNAAPIVNETVSDPLTPAPTVDTPPTQPDKVFTQQDIAKITGRVREETRSEYYERGKKDALAELERSRTSESNQSQSLGGIEQVPIDQVNRLVEEKIKELSYIERGNQAATQFMTKIDAVKEKYSDFDETVAQLNLQAHPEVVVLANQLDNTGDVIYDMSKNPSKYAYILTLVNNRTPELALKEMKRLSNSIKKNEEAKKAPNAKEPLSQLKPSTVGTDNGAMSVRDLRRQPWLRG